MGDVRDLGSAPGAGRAASRADRDVLVLDARRSAPRAARHWVLRRVAEAGVQGPANQVVELLTGEVVANAVLHGPQHGRVRVAVRIDHDGVRVSVTDESPASPQVQHPAPTAVSGRGMVLVEALSRVWGVDRNDGSGKTVWFVVDPEVD